MRDHAGSPANAGPTGPSYMSGRPVAVRAARGVAVLGIMTLVGARPTALPLAPTRDAPIRACSSVDAAWRPSLYTIPLLPDQGMSGSGLATLVPAPSPFGITVTADGHPIFDVTVTVQNLASAGGGAKYVVWATTQDLADADKIGEIGSDQKVMGKVAWNKYIVLVTAEPVPIGAHWKGPVVLRGFSPATYLANYASHPLFLGGMPPC